MVTVSVIIPTFNGSKFLGTAIESVLNQTYQDFELIVVDDGSTDDTRKVVSQFGEKVFYFYQPNQGSPQARNAGLRLTRGIYLALLDSDDVFLPDRLERGVEFLNRTPDVALVHGETQVVDSYGKPVPEATEYNRGLYAKERREGSSYFRILDGNAMFPSTILFRRECLDRVGFFDPAFPPREDYDWYLRFALDYKVQLLESPPVCQYRLHNQNQSNRYDAEAIARVYVAILNRQLSLIRTRFQGIQYRKMRSRILAKQAEYHWTNHSKQEVRESLLEAIRLDPSIALDWRSLRRLIFSL